MIVSGCETNLDYSQYIDLPTTLFKTKSSDASLPKETGIIKFSTYSIVRAKNGEKLYNVANRINVSSKQLAVYNGLSENYKLSQGEILAIPVNLKENKTDDTINIAKMASKAIDRVQVKKDTIVKEVIKVKEEDNESNKTIKADDIQTSSNDQQLKTKSFLKPIDGEISNPFSYDTNGNQGINIKAPEGSPVAASNNGTVALVSKGENQPTIIFIKHKDNILSAYTNISDVNLQKGDLVKRGQIIGSVAPGKNFLHFEMIKDNQRVDPIQFFEQ
jgi:murein DD-endopeptidase MepM/ murein hydrolase activator NlpD